MGVVAVRPCAECLQPFDPPHGNTKMCSQRCVNARREKRRKLACAVCGEPMWHSHTLSKSPTCNPCRRLRDGYRVPNMRARGMMQRWSCEGCGAACERPATKGQRPKWCETCRVLALRNKWIRLAPAERLAIYVRDDWTCWLCQEPVDRSLVGSRSEWRPSLDHVLPRSKGGSDEPTNLRLAHFWCNSARSDGRAYEPEDFRVTA